MYRCPIIFRKELISELGYYGRTLFSPTYNNDKDRREVHKLKVLFILQRGHIMKKENNRELELDNNQISILLNSKKIEYPINQGDSLRMIKAVVEDSTFIVEEQLTLRILLKEIDY